MRKRLTLARAVVFVALAGPACHHEPSSAAEQAKRLFGADTSVSPAGIPVPDADVFIAVPNPVPNDYEGYEAALIPRSGDPLRGADAVRFVWAHGVRDPELLAQVTGLFLGNSRQVGHAKNRNVDVIRGHEHLEDPVLSGTTLVFFAVRGSMAPVAYQMTVDFQTFKASERPAADL